MAEEMIIKELDDVVVRFSGDSGDGMQLAGNMFSNISAAEGNDISTFPDYPADIRAPQGTLTGVSGLAGHVGHILSGVTDTECGCGRRGCVEAVSSGRAIMGAAKNKLAGYSTKYIFELARQGYKEAEFLTERSASTIAELIVSLKLLLDCQVVVVGGSVGLADGYVQKVSKHLSIYSEICNVMLFPAYFRSDSGLIGATLWDRDCIT